MIPMPTGATEQLIDINMKPVIVKGYSKENTFGMGNFRVFGAFSEIGVEDRDDQLLRGNGL